MRWLSAAITAALLMAGPAAAQPKTLAIGTGGTGGIYYPLGGAIANVLSGTAVNGDDS
jgi:TRAP-type uncharacterized transport system substrate-binding protein